MDRNKIIILVLIVVIAALLVGIMATMPNFNKKDTKLAFKSNATLTEGDSLKIKLTDGNGTALANQTVNVTIVNKDKSKDYHSVETNDKGIGTIKIDKKPGKYNVTVSYAGNDHYKGCNATKNINIKEKVVEAQTSSSSSQTSTTPRYTTDEHGTYDNVNDMYIDRQFKGSSKAEVAEFEAKIARDGGMVWINNYF